MHKSLPDDYCTIASNQVLSFLQLLNKTETINRWSEKTVYARNSCKNKGNKCLEDDLMNQELVEICLRVRDIDATLDFYTNLFNFEVASRREFPEK